MSDPETILDSLGGLAPAGAEDRCAICGEAAQIIWVGDAYCAQCTGRDQDDDGAPPPQRC